MSFIFLQRKAISHSKEQQWVTNILLHGGGGSDSQKVHGGIVNMVVESEDNLITWFPVNIKEK